MKTKKLYPKLYDLKSCLIPVIFLGFLIFISLLYTHFHPIPTEANSGTIGLGSTALNIGDRDFYLYDSMADRNFGNVKPSFLYPLVLRFITLIVGLFGANETSEIWNLIVISITSIFSFLTLIFIHNIAWELFGDDVARISSWLYVICPYTLFFAISGSLTNYIILGVTYCYWIIIKSNILNSNKRSRVRISEKSTLIILSIVCVYLSSLRPTGCIFSIVLLTSIIVFLLLKKIKVKSKDFGIFSIPLISIIFAIWQLQESIPYINYAIHITLNERGQFFGVDREILRSRLKDDFTTINLFLKNTLYLFFWKTSDFISGLSDIRDTHTIFDQSSNNNYALFPFLIRVFTGIFYFFPINVVSILGLIQYRKIVFRSGTWIILLAILITLSPSLLGVAINRYLFMFYAPFIIFASTILAQVKYGIIK